MTLVVSGKTPFTREDCFALKSDAEDVLRQRCPTLVKQFEQRGWRLPSTIDRVYDPGLAKSELGWESRYDADEVFAQLDGESLEVLPPDVQRLLVLELPKFRAKGQYCSIEILKSGKIQARPRKF